MREPADSDASVDAIVAHALSYRYGDHAALRRVDLTIPRGATYALLGPNGSGKSALMHVLMGLRRASSGYARIHGRDVARLTPHDRQMIGYVAEGQQLPRWMRIGEFEAYLRPLYPAWDGALAKRLRDRFMLDPARKLGTLSRGEYMKAALLFALAARPQLLLLDEPFTGMDVSVKDELIRGLLESASQDGCTVVICSHDLVELETLVDWVGFMAEGRMHMSDTIEHVSEQFRHVDVVTHAQASNATHTADDTWLSVEHSGRRMSFVAPNVVAGFEELMTARFPGAVHLEIRPATLREIFLALTQRSRSMTMSTSAAA